MQPVALGIRHNGELLPREELLGQDGTKTAACQLVGQPAGESMTGLELVLLDASGAPAVQPTPGRVAVSWRQGCPRKNWDGQPLKLPNKLAVSAVLLWLTQRLESLAACTGTPLSHELTGTWCGTDASFAACPLLGWPPHSRRRSWSVRPRRSGCASRQMMARLWRSASPSALCVPATRQAGLCLWWTRPPVRALMSWEQSTAGSYLL